MLLSAKEITQLSNNESLPLIKPFVEQKVKEGLSYGLEPYGYTARLSHKVISTMNWEEETLKITPYLVNPKDKQNRNIKEITKDSFIILPQQHVICSTVEYFNFPLGVQGIIVIKSSYARCGLIGSFAGIEPGYSGCLSLNLINPTVNPIKLYINEGIAQINFFKGDITSTQKYEGKYGNTDAPQV